ncbi:unnamed protein product, partial [Cyprideis torosa]
VGDHLLEVCGINMRKATYDLAASVLRQLRESITMLVEYCPEKLQESLESSCSMSSDEEDNSPTPCNSPKSSRPQTQLLLEDVSPSATSTLRAPLNLHPFAAGDSLTRRQLSDALGSLQNKRHVLVALSPGDHDDLLELLFPSFPPQR